MVKNKINKKVCWRDLSFCGKALRVALVVSLIVFLVGLYFNFAGFFRENLLYANLFICIISFLALFSMFNVFRRFPSNFPREKRGKLFLVIGLLLFFLGDLYWLIEEVVKGDLVPIGGLSDLFWNLGYWALIVGVIYFIYSGFVSSHKFIWIALAMGLVIGGVYFYFDVAEDVALNSLNFIHFIQDLYFVYDFLLLSLLVVLLWPLIKDRNKFFYGWIVLGMGILVRLIYDILFAGLTERGFYYTGHWIDLLYVGSYLLIIFSNFIKSKMLEGRE